MITIALALAAQAAAAVAVPAPVPAPPKDWTTLPVLADMKATDGDNLSSFVAAEVKAGRCAAATGAASRWTLKVDAAVMISAAGLARQVVPRAINCPSVEQYAAGLISSMVRGGAAASLPQPAEGWYHTSLTFSWPA